MQYLIDRINALHPLGPRPISIVCDPDPVSVHEQPDEAGIPGERQTAPPPTLPKGTAGQEEHGALRRLFFQSQVGPFLPVQHRHVFMYIVFYSLLFYNTHV